MEGLSLRFWKHSLMEVREEARQEERALELVEVLEELVVRILVLPEGEEEVVQEELEVHSLQLQFLEVLVVQVDEG